MPELMNDRNQAQLSEQQNKQQQNAAQQPRLEQQSAVALVSARLSGRPPASEIGTMLKQLQGQGRLGADELVRVRDLLTRTCGNDYARDALSRVGGSPQLQPGAARPQTLQEAKAAGLVRKDFLPGTLSQQLNKAMAGAGTDEEAIWRIVEGCNPHELRYLQEAYLKVYGKDLVAELKTEMSGAELRRALAPFGRSSEAPETAGEWVSHKAERVKEDTKNGLEVLADLASIVKDLGINPISQEGTVTVDVGKAYYYLRPFLPPHIAQMLNVDPASGANKVTLYVNLKSKVATVSSPALVVRGMNYPNFFCGSCALNNVMIRATNFDPLRPANAGSAGTATIAGATMQNATFTSKPLGSAGARLVRASKVELGNLLLQANAVAKGAQGGPADGLVSNLSFRTAKVTGLSYPGMPPVDFEVNHAALNFETLWNTLAQSASHDGPQGQPEGELPKLPSLLPADSRVKVVLSGLYGSGALVQGGQEQGGPQAAGFRQSAPSSTRPRWPGRRGPWAAPQRPRRAA